MPRAKDTVVRIVSETAEHYVLQIGPYTQHVSKGELNDMLHSGGDPFVALKSNLVIAASLAGLENFDDTIAVQQLLNSRQFKIIRD